MRGGKATLCARKTLRGHGRSSEHALAYHLVVFGDV